ncbi:hypothetical protein QBC40DRAFT_333364 [Triangularia verruculosa]|uniref:SET domain-containing protein n=1 Tax=Triangularia verruculosa TaxID=2587418 RepID=A0AAN7AU36_9PEZI|nr:hypothetical protein QBC40DRAFT_333364 [Triangularia verruculosa]
MRQHTRRSQAQDFPQILAHLEEQKRMLCNARAHTGQRPARKNDNIATISLFNFTRMSTQRKQESDLGIMRTSFIPPPYAPCAQPFCDLKKVMFDDLVLETHHRGTYLLVRVVTPQNRMNAIMAIVEDERNEVLLLQLYHQTEMSEDILVPGQVLIIKDPYLKLTADGGYGLRVDHLSDVVFLPAHDGRIPFCWHSELTNPQHKSADYWKTKGNDCFRQSKYLAAVEQALVCSPTPEEGHTIKLNRALVLLKMGHFDEALANTDSATSDFNAKDNEKALFRRAQALYGLRRYRECCDVLKTLRLAYPGNTAAIAKLNEAISRLAEQTTGKYQFAKFRLEATRLRPPQLNHATYIGPVEVHQSGSRGSGLFTTRAVKAGELIFCEKALVYVFHKRDGSSSDDRLMSTILIDINTGNFTIGAQPELITMLVQKVYQNPSLASTVRDLHRGSYSPVQGTFDITDGKPVIDSFLLTRILLLNNFACRLQDTQADGQPTLSSALDRVPSLGLWAFASRMNHSCISNAYRSFIGDMMIVRATKDIPANSEVTIQYLNPTNPHRQKKFVQNWAFSCECAMCQDDDQTSSSVIAKRNRLGESIQAMLRLMTRRGSSSGAGSIASLIRKCSAGLAELESTYNNPAEKVPRLALWKGYRDLACALTMAGAGVNSHFDKIIEAGLKGLQCLGFAIEGGGAGRGKKLVIQTWGYAGEGLVDCWLCLKDAYTVTGSHELALAAESYARMCHRIYYGDDESYGKLG